MVYFFAFPVRGANRVAVVKGKYDKVERVLRSMRISYDLISFQDLEDAAIIKNYEALFLPCGMNYPVESNVKILARGRNIQSVTLKDDFYEPHMEKITAHIKDFIRAGGYAYFSGYSFDVLNNCFHVMDFHDDFPYMGMPGRITSKLKEDLACFCMDDEMALYMGHSGWITIKSVNGPAVLAEAQYATPRGERSGPISFFDTSGRGGYLYTVYHSTVYSDFRRFNVYRVAGGPCIRELEDIVFSWDQERTVSFADALMGIENSRTYRVPLRKGVNSIYFKSEEYPFQVVVLDESYSLIESRDLPDLVQTIDIHSKDDAYCYVRVFPSTRDRYSIYAIVSAHGMRILPYFFKFLYGAGALCVIAGIVVMIRLGKRGYSGLGRVIK